MSPEIRSAVKSGKGKVDTGFGLSHLLKWLSMLVLTRRKEEIIVIEFADGTTLALAVIDIDRNKVRIGIDATPDVRIYRKEVWDAIRRAQRMAIDSPEAVAKREADEEVGKDYA